MRYEDYSPILVVRDRQVSWDSPYPCLCLDISETAKSLETVQHIWDWFFEQGLTRRGLVIAVGGGVLTDMVGFAASTYKRGVRYVNVPTTLLAMVDASSGGKTGINYRGLKNSIGVFADPVETIIDTRWLQSLPAKELLSGFGEMLKTGLIAMHNAQCTMHNLWAQLLQYDLERMPVEELQPLIEQCVAVKEKIVKADPKEEGLRKVLNLGHTFGHALEEVTGYGLQVTGAMPHGYAVEEVTGYGLQVTGAMPHGYAVEEVTGDGLQVTGTMPHGYAVVYGMIAELYLSVTKLNCPKEPLQQLTQIMLHYYGKPQCKCSDREQLIALMQQDKKNERAASINCTLLRAVGEPVINQEISCEEAGEALDYLFSL